jgi:hypothetical protein
MEFTLLVSQARFLRDLLQIVFHSNCDSLDLRSLNCYGRTAKETPNFCKLCFFSLCITADMCLHKTVTNEFPYCCCLNIQSVRGDLLGRYLPQKRLFLVLYLVSAFRVVPDLGLEKQRIHVFASSAGNVSAK